MAVSMVGRVQPRSRAQRRIDTERRLDADIDLWVATGSQFGGPPHLVPLSFLWYDDAVVLCTGASTVTGRNLETTGYVRLALGELRDVVLIDGIAEVLRDPPPELMDAFAHKASWDPRGESEPYLWFAVRPSRIQVWRSVDEDPERTIYRDGAWLS